MPIWFRSILKTKYLINCRESAPFGEKKKEEGEKEIERRKKEM